MKSLLLSLLLLLSVDIMAQSIIIDGFQYSIDNGKATLNYIDPMADSISREIVVPSSVKIDGKQYPVKIIGKEAFRFAEIESITIPNSVDSIAPRTFFRCQKLTKVKLPERLRCITPPFVKNTIDYYLYKKRLAVPAGAVKNYKKDENCGRKDVVSKFTN